MSTSPKSLEKKMRMIAATMIRHSLPGSAARKRLVFMATPPVEEEEQQNKRRSDRGDEPEHVARHCRESVVRIEVEEEKQGEQDAVCAHRQEGGQPLLRGKAVCNELDGA